MAMGCNHSWNPPPSLLKKGGRTLQKLIHLGGGGVRNFLLERGDKPEKGEEVDVEMGVATFFTTLQFSSIIFTFSDLQSFELAMQDFHPHSHPNLVLKPGIICTFLIHSGSLQKMLTAFLKQLYKSFPILFPKF